MIIAVDFDGTIVEDKYPKIGKLRKNAIEVFRKLQEEGHYIILWTCRDGSELEEAVLFLKENGFVPDKINDHSDRMIELYPNSKSKKVYADIYIDDRNFSSYCNDMFLDWKFIYKAISGKELWLGKKRKKKN